MLEELRCSDVRLGCLPSANEFEYRDEKAIKRMSAKQAEAARRAQDAAVAP